MAEQQKNYGTLASNSKDETKQKPTDLEGGEEQQPDNFQYSHGLTSEEAQERLLKYGPNCLPEKTIPLWYIFLSLLWQPMPCMIWLAIFIEIGIGNYLDVGILAFIQLANASVGFYETTKAADAVAALKASLTPQATVYRDGKWRPLDATKLVPGDLVQLNCGAAIPADCRINQGEGVHGNLEVDTSQLTGESLPEQKFPGDKVMMGSTVVRGEMEGTVEFTGAETFFGKTAALLASEGEQSNLQNTIIDIMIVLVLLCTTLCSIVLIYLVQITSVVNALSFTVVLLVASIPLAIEIVTTTTLAVGSKELSHHGAIVTRLTAIEDMAGMSILCSDKTGTLTLNQMMIQPETPVYKEGETQYTVLRYAAMAAKWKEPPKDALDRLVLGSVDLPSLDKVELVEHLPFDPTIKRTEGTVIENGKKFKTTKGAPNILLRLVQNPSVTELVTNDVKKFGSKGVRCLAVAKTDENGKWEFLGLLTFLDPPRPDTAVTIQQARQYGVAVKMITGDHLLIARETSRRLDLGENIFNADGLPLLDKDSKKKPTDLSEKYGDLCLGADGFAQVFPEHKYLIVECLREMGYKVGMTGDGVNDAPALKRADVGVAVKGATDAANAAADIVLTEEGLSTIIHGIIIARCIFLRIRNYFTYRIAATLLLLFFFFIAVFSFKPSEFQPYPLEDDYVTTWPIYFSTPVLMLMLITLLNDGCLISIGYDNVESGKEPERWNLRVLFTIGGVLGLIGSFSLLLLLWMLLDSWNDGSVFQAVGIGGVNYGQITTSIYLALSVQSFLTIFSARSGEQFFWSSSPSLILLIAAGLSLAITTIVACFWPASFPDGIYTVGLVLDAPYILPAVIWVYCLVWWLIQDSMKVLTFMLLRSYDIFGINESGRLILPEKTRNWLNSPETQAQLSKQSAH